MTASPFILVVDDEAVILEVARRVLESDGCRVVTAPDAETALEHVAVEAPDVAVVDLKLPGLSGLELLGEVRSNHPQVVVIVTTGFASSAQAVASLASGAFDFLPKPFTFDELLSPVRRAVRYHALSERDRTPAPGGTPGDVTLLGVQAWARPEADGSVLLGVTDVFQRTVGPISGVVLPDARHHLLEGGRLARIEAADGLVHVAWSARSGVVLGANDALEASPDLLVDDPYGAGWLARILPTAG